MINIKKVQGTTLLAAPISGHVAAEPVWLWRISATKGGVVQQITTRSFEAMLGIIALRKRAGWKVAHRSKIRAAQ